MAAFLGWVIILLARGGRLQQWASHSADRSRRSFAVQLSFGPCSCLGFRWRRSSPGMRFQVKPLLRNGNFPLFAETARGLVHRARVFAHAPITLRKPAPSRNPLRDCICRYRCPCHPVQWARWADVTLPRQGRNSPGPQRWLGLGETAVCIVRGAACHPSSKTAA